MPRGWNSTGPPRASTMATPYREPRIRDDNGMGPGLDEEEEGGGVFMVSDRCCRSLSGGAG